MPPRYQTRRGKSDAQPQPGLRYLVQERLLKDVFQSASEKSKDWKILILDDAATRVISAAVGMYDIMEKNISLVESINKVRAPFPTMDAIYVIEPSPRSVRLLIKDYANPKEVLYGNSVFVYFLGTLSEQLFGQIKTCKPLLKRLKALSEINVDFLAKEERAFHLNMRSAFSNFYLRQQSLPVEVELAEKLVTVCATLNEYPHIRYRQSSALCTSLASVFHLKMDEFVAKNPSWWYHGGPGAVTTTGTGSKKKPVSSTQAAQRERGILLLLDRADDCLTPLLHDFTYQAMVQDLLDVKEDRITYHTDQTARAKATPSRYDYQNNEEEKQAAAEKEQEQKNANAKDALLDERDVLWVEIRGMHIAQVIETLSTRIRNIMESSSGSVLGAKSGSQSGNLSLSQMAAALKALPEYKEVMSKLSQHMHLSHECMDIFKAQSLLELSELEQTLATGKDEEGRSPKLAELLDKTEAKLARMQNANDRLRLVLILTISQGGLKAEDKKRILAAANFPPAQLNTLNCIETLGLATTASLPEKNRLVSLLTGDRLHGSGVSDDNAEYAASRYVSPLKIILEELAHNQLSFDEYPSLLPMPEQAAAASSSNAGGSARKRGGSTTSASSSANSSSGGPIVGSARKTSGASSKWSKSSSSTPTPGPASTNITGGTNFNGGRAIVFIIGGMAYPELRIARQVMASENKEIIIGSTAFVSPKDFLDDLATLSPSSSSGSN